MIDAQTASTKEARPGSLLVIFLIVMVDLMGFGMVIPLLPKYADVFAVDPSGWLIGLLMASYSLMQFIFAPVWGLLSDRIGRRPVLMVGLAGSIVWYVLFGWATIQQSLAWLFVTRIGGGIAGATIPTAQAYIADVTTGSARTRGMALFGMAFGIGFTVGPMVAWLAVPSGQGDPGPWPGFVAAMFSATALVLAIVWLPESRAGQASGRRWLDVAGLRAALRRPPLRVLMIAYFVCLLGFVLYETTLSLLLMGSRDFPDPPFQYSWQSLCLTFVLIGVTLAVVQGGVVRPLARRVADAPLALVGCTCEAVGFGLTIAAVARQSNGLLLTGMVIIVVGFAFLQPTLNAMISRQADASRQGGVLGTTQSLNALGRILGAAVAIPLLKWRLTSPYWMGGLLISSSAILIVWSAVLARRQSTVSA
jgi:MFS family permease